MTLGGDRELPILGSYIGARGKYKEEIAGAGNGQRSPTGSVSSVEMEAQYLWCMGEEGLKCADCSRARAGDSKTIQTSCPHHDAYSTENSLVGGWASVFVENGRKSGYSSRQGDDSERAGDGVATVLTAAEGRIWGVG